MFLRGKNDVRLDFYLISMFGYEGFDNHYRITDSEGNLLVAGAVTTFAESALSTTQGFDGVSILGPDPLWQTDSWLAPFHRLSIRDGVCPPSYHPNSAPDWRRRVGVRFIALGEEQKTVMDHGAGEIRTADGREFFLRVGDAYFSEYNKLRRLLSICQS